MPNDKRNKQEQPRDEQQRDSSAEQGSETQPTGNERDDNPQDGGSWNNYRTREMGGEGSGETFYRNRERGNYEEGQPSEDDGGGGSLY